jgi:hypothetical protein
MKLKPDSSILVVQNNSVVQKNSVRAIPKPVLFNIHHQETFPQNLLNTLSPRNIYEVIPPEHCVPVLLLSYLNNNLISL